MALELRDLKESNEFLNAVIDNINSGVFVVDKSLRIQELNEALKRLFGRSEESLLGELCGNALGCAFAVLEQDLCGQTSHCKACELRNSISKTFTEGVPAYKRKLVREFYIDSMPVLKHFEYTTRYVRYHGREMILVIVDDITEGELQRLALIEKQKRIEEDLKAAAGIQQTLLPQQLPRIEGLEIAWRFEPCELIGGDIFNAFELNDHQLGCYLLDVSGHGVPAALVTVSVSQALATLRTTESVLSPSSICRSLDDLYPLERFHTFLTMIYLVIDHRVGYFDYTSAGHPPLALLRANGSIEWLHEGGTIIGMKGIMPFEEQRVALRAGDRIILYTDGVIEHRNPQRELYGRQRLSEAIKAMKDCSIDELLGGVWESVKAFGGNEPLRDDVSLLGIEYRG